MDQNRGILSHTHKPNTRNWTPTIVIRWTHPYIIHIKCDIYNSNLMAQICFKINFISNYCEISNFTTLIGNRICSLTRDAINFSATPKKLGCSCTTSSNSYPKLLRTYEVSLEMPIVKYNWSIVDTTFYALKIVHHFVGFYMFLDPNKIDINFCFLILTIITASIISILLWSHPLMLPAWPRSRQYIYMLYLGVKTFYCLGGRAIISTTTTLVVRRLVLL